VRTVDIVLLAVLVMTHSLSTSLTLGAMYLAVVIFSVAQIFFDVAYPGSEAFLQVAQLD
jgi:hypothetical protein